MRRLIYEGSRKLTWREASDVGLSGDESAVVRPIASTTCDLDRAIVLGRSPFAGPFAIGHEGVAEVIDVGDAVAGVAPGDVVVVPWHICCGTCERCAAGLTAHCERVPRFAMYGVPLGGDYGGLFDDLVAVPWARALVPVPAGVDPISVASASDNLTDAWRAVEPTLRRKPGASVLVLGGTGSIGFYATAWARVLGADRVDFFDQGHEAAVLASEHGAHVVDELSEPPATATYDLVVDASGDPAVLAAGMRLLAPAGHCHSVGIYFDDNTALPLRTAYMTGTSFTTGRPDVLGSIPDVLRHVADGSFDPTSVFSDRIDWDDAPDALAQVLRKPVVTRPRLGQVP